MKEHQTHTWTIWHVESGYIAARTRIDEGCFRSDRQEIVAHFDAIDGEDALKMWEEVNRETKI